MQRDPRSTQSEAYGENRKRKRRRFQRLLSFLKKAVVLLTSICIVVSIVNLFVARPSYGDLLRTVTHGKFLDGITINGYNVGGMTYHEARNTVVGSVEAHMKLIGMTIINGNKLWLLSAADMGVTSTLDEVLTEAMLYGQNSTITENARIKKELLESEKSFFVRFRPDPGTLKTKLEQINQSVATPPREPIAQPDIWSASPSFNYIEGVSGHSMDVNALAEQITHYLSTGALTYTMLPALELTEPETDMEWLKANTQLRAKFTTEYGSSRTLKDVNRIANILKAANLLRGAVVKAGEAFSFNEYIGPRTEIGGWPPAPGIVNGNTYELQPGGGICQVSTTLYNALLLCGKEVEITVRKHHTWPSAYVDYGLDATVSTGGPDLAFQNNTGAPLYIFAYADNTNYKITVYIYGEPLPAGITYKVYSTLDETLPKPSPELVERSDWPAGYKKADYPSRNGYIATAYRQKLKDQVPVEGELEKLYTDKYRAITGKTSVGTGDPSLPKPGG